MRLFEIPEIITLSGQRLSSEMEFDEMALVAGGNGCDCGGGTDNGCCCGGGTGNGCGAGGGSVEIE